MPPSPRTTVRAAAALLPDGLHGPVEVAVDGGRIDAVRPGPDPGDGSLLAPGFVDLQVNGVDDVDVAVADGADWDRLAALLAPTGVTAWLPTLVSRPLDRYGAPLARIAAAALGAAHGAAAPVVLGAHLEGPFLGARLGAHDPRSVVPLDLQWLAALPPTVRLVTLAPEQAGADEAIRELVARGVVVSLGHSGADVATTSAAVDAGARMVTHLFNAMAAVHQREPGIAGAALADDRVVAGLIVDLVHVHPALVRTAFRAKGAAGIALVTDAVAWRAGHLAALEVRLVDGAPRLADGTLAGSALTMDAAVRNAVHVAGVPVADALRAASTTPAEVLGDADRGRIAAGARADLVLLDAERLAVRRTLVGGEVVWEA
ncbi:MAG TPA: amidohydrolase family protein [Acidimicrobiales bacterium]|nr:amidohydrolase family protein [Acidimicrobiales bacterium]